MTHSPPIPHNVLYDSLPNASRRPGIEPLVSKLQDFLLAPRTGASAWFNPGKVYSDMYVGQLSLDPEGLFPPSPRKAVLAGQRRIEHLGFLPSDLEGLEVNSTIITF